jgi:cholest-4-en-3-one 26-monooxygenase
MTAAPPDLAGIDIASHEAYAAGIPHEAFALLRRHDPVHWHPWDWETGGFWAITKFEDVVTVSKDPRTFSSAVGHINLWDLEEDAREARRSMLEHDPPEHTRLRRIVSSAFTPKQVREYEASTREITAGLLDAALEEGDVDWVEAVSAPLPINVFVSILGIPDEDAALMVELSDALVAGTSAAPVDPTAYGNMTPLRLLPFQSPASHALFEYGRAIGEERRRNPTDDLVSRLVQAEVDGDRLTDGEYCNFFQVLVFAGNETTRTAMSHGILELARNPGELERLHSDPSLIPRAVEEIVRYATPVVHFRRTVTRDAEIRGVPIRAGERVVMWYSSANFDEEVFDEPLRFDVGRDNGESAAFGGGGPHYCLGAWLARLELRLLLEEIVARGLRVELRGDPDLVPSNFVRGIRSLPVRLTRG